MPTQIAYLEILKQSFTLVILLFCSVVSLAFALERWWYFRKSRVDGDRLLAGVQKMLSEGKADQAKAACQKNPAPVSQLVYYGLLHMGRAKADIEELLASKRLEERLKMER